MLRCLQPVHARHTDIEQHELRRMRRNGGQGLDPVSRFSHDLTDPKLADQRGEPLARERLIIYDEDRIFGAFIREG